MADFQIPDKTLLTSVDRASDSLLIYDLSATSLKRTTVNNLLNVTSQPLGLTDTQSPTNKTFNNTNTVTLLDTLFTLQDNSDNTKQAQFQLSGISTGTTRTYTLPNASSTLVDLTSTQSLSAKTLIGATITDATISNPTLTVNTISEYTAANGVTIDGLNIKDGALVGAVITNSNLSTTAGEPGGAWDTWSPTLSGITIGSGTSTAYYKKVGKTIEFRYQFTFGSGSAMGTGVISLPSTATTTGITVAKNVIGEGWADDSSTSANNTPILVRLETSTTIRPLVQVASTSNLSTAGFSTTVPFTWATGDILYMQGKYEQA